ncbi:1,2-phenylacetyl-CoA epoxidase subunit PaaC [Brevibacillus daliensis]|uniref:1,2-phenylacetyl-CoA epoxidase subunit PaaC n=1 Tax=Brevibacillus daliensis TaxID=2892995 RepID=UPI001E3EC700|nr:1,2-phenylacetyl-CoA epoxidase subunit PaaC [Brevibacillus daliensis]
MVQFLQVDSAQKAQENPEYKAALTELLFQLADDDFILAYRGSEWLGLAPHIEEDVAFSSMSQDMMGHAVMHYELLDELGLGKADDLAQLRKPEEFRNVILAERKNGSGEYNDAPKYDWAYAIARHFVYGSIKQVKLEALRESSYQKLSFVSRKMLTEHRYHMMHWQVWMKQLANSTDDAKQKLEAALEKVWVDAGELFSYGKQAATIVGFGIVASEESLREKWYASMQQKFTEIGLNWPGDLGIPAESGRDGQHTPDLANALQTLSEVYVLDPQASW